MVLTSESKERVSLVSTVVREEILQLPYLLIVIQTSRDRNTTCIHQSLDYTIPPGTQTDTRIKLKGKGVPNLKNPTQRGDHYVTLVVQVPEKLTEEQKKILNQYEQATLVETRPATDSAGPFTFGDHKRRKKK